MTEAKQNTSAVPWAVSFTSAEFSSTQNSVTWRNNLNFLNFLNHLKEVTLPTILVGRMDSKDVGKSLPEKKRFCLREAPFRALRISVAPRWSVENDRADNGKTKRKYHPIKPVKLQ